MAKGRTLRPSSDMRPRSRRVAQPDLGGVAHRDDAALAGALGYGGHAGEGSEGGVVPAADRPGSFGEQGREGDRADPGQRMQDSCVARPAALGCRGLVAQVRAELIELAFSLMEFAVGPSGQLTARSDQTPPEGTGWTPPDGICVPRWCRSTT